MQLRDDDRRAVRTRTLWLLLAVAIGALEALIPRIPLFPWFKPGFSHVITMLWIIEYGTTDALLFSCVRVWISGYYLGFSFFSLGLAFCGSVCATVGMGIVWRLSGRGTFLGTIGLGIAGACLHNGGQLAVLSILFGCPAGLSFQVPFMIGASLVFGCITGMGVVPLRRYLLTHDIASVNVTPMVFNPVVAKMHHWLFSCSLLAASAALLAVRDGAVLCVCALVVTAAASVIRHSPVIVVRGIIARFWPLFLFVAFINFLEPAGTFFSGIPFLTHEALSDTVRQWLRLWCWLALAPVLTAAGFETVFFIVLSRLFKRHGLTLSAGALSLVHFGSTFSAALSSARTVTVDAGGLRHPVRAVRLWFAMTLDGIEKTMDSGIA
jgi:uncharacterized membrane protein